MKISMSPFRLLMFLGMVSLNATSACSQVVQQSSAQQTEPYQCMPCGNDCDSVIFDESGKCPACQMSLVKKSTITFTSIEPSEICNYIKEHPEVVLLDVRTKEEFEGKATPHFGTLKNAINIPVQELESKLSSISILKSKQIIVYCSHSHRSPRASYLLTQNGFANIINMAGGMSMLGDNNVCKK